MCIRKLIRLRLLGMIIHVYFVSLKKYMNPLCGKMQNFLFLQQVVYTQLPLGFSNVKCKMYRRSKRVTIH